MTVAIDYPWALGAAVGLGVIAATAVQIERVRRRRRLARFGPASAIARVVSGDVTRAHGGRRALRLAMAAGLAGIAFAGPRWGTPSGTATTSGIDVVFAIDASLSMLAPDEAPNRLERARQEARRLRALSRGDRVGLIVFAGRSYILSPLTVDDGALSLFLDTLDPSIVGQPGTSLASALHQGVDLLGPALAADRALVVFTDGEAFDDEPAVLAEARRVRDAGVKLVLIGFGTADGSTIPIHVTDKLIAPKRDADGQIVTTRYDARLLSAAADAANGTFIEASATDKASRARAALTGLKAERRRITTQQSIPARYQWFLAPALCLILFDLYATRRRAQRMALATAAAAVVLLGPRPAFAQTNRLLQTAEREYSAHQPLAAARAWRRAIEGGDRHPETLYNLGTAYLAADSLDAAIEILERAATIPIAPLRSDAQFNLGLAYLRRGMEGKGEAASSSLQGAVRAYRSVLLAQPSDSAARWNYELAKKKLASASPSAGGGGGGGGGAQSQPRQNLDRNQAEQLLDAAARDERDVESKRQRAERPIVVRGKDW